MCITSSFLALACDLEEVIQSELNIVWGERNFLTMIKLVICCLGYLNRHIFRWNIEKGTILIHSRRIEKCPTPGQRFSDKFPTAGTDKMTNARQTTGGGGGWAPFWNQVTEPSFVCDMFLTTESTEIHSFPHKDYVKNLSMPKAHLEAHNIKIYLTGTCFSGSLVSPNKLNYFWNPNFVSTKTL